MVRWLLLCLYFLSDLCRVALYFLLILLLRRFRWALCLVVPSRP